MLVTLPGIVMLDRLVQPQNARFPMLVTLPGMMAVVPSAESQFFASFVIYFSFFFLGVIADCPGPWAGDVENHFQAGFHFFPILIYGSNAQSPMRVTLSGIVILDRLVQPENAQPPMLVTLPGIVMLDRSVQP